MGQEGRLLPGELDDHPGRPSIFVPGHLLATGLPLGADGSCSNIAAMSPRGAAAWYRLMRTDPAAELDVERRIGAFFRLHIAPLRAAGLSNPALDKFLAAVGGWPTSGRRCAGPRPPRHPPPWHPPAPTPTDCCRSCSPDEAAGARRPSWKTVCRAGRRSSSRAVADDGAAVPVPLSSIRQPRRELGRVAAELLLEETDDGEQHRHRQVLFAPEMIVRAGHRRARPARTRPRR
ncbi:substrate-binding domain-containing protein [Nonomuraea wenchangensis]|uniref:substrate-binding domain-containing protein n=1 Tax=Nonomuraea wenchangensis TaxID=568860 RepID=UPI00341BB2A7